MYHKNQYLPDHRKIGGEANKDTRSQARTVATSLTAYPNQRTCGDRQNDPDRDVHPARMQGQWRP
jgi:hypothetical protein